MGAAMNAEELKLSYCAQHVLPHIPGQAELSPWFEYKGLPLRW